jgi:solute carrier family 6 (neurotransmitter transporter)
MLLIFGGFYFSSDRLSVNFLLQLGIFVVHFLDYTIGSSWWLMVLYLIEIVVVFVVRGRPYSGETVVATLFSRSTGCLCAWAAPLLIFTWNVILPIVLVVRCCTSRNMTKVRLCDIEWKCCLSFWQVLCIMVFKNGRFRDLYSWRSLTYNYWPVWTREVGCML